MVKLLYGGPLEYGGTAEHRLRAFRRLGVDVVPFDISSAENFDSLRYLAERFQAPIAVRRLNRNLIARAKASNPDVVWLDKPILILASTVRQLRSLGADVIDYMPDDPFGPRRDGIWRLFEPAVGEYTAHIVSREVTGAEFEARGPTRSVLKLLTFEPSVHYPAEAVALKPSKTYDVTFIGYPYDQRAQWIIDMIRQSPGVRFGVFGPGWARHASELAELGVPLQDAVWNDAYREALWRSRLSLSFITRSNRDIMSHKAVEIAAAGIPPIVEPSPVQRKIFQHGKSAFFFEEPSQLASVVQEALAMGDKLEQVGREAARAVWKAGLSNDDALRKTLGDLGYSVG